MIQNPILPGFKPDPSTCRVGDDYYVTPSTFEWFSGVQIYHSRDLQHWRLLTHSLHDQLDLGGVPRSGGIWAPALSHYEGIFYLCYPVVHQHEAATKDTPDFLATATVTTRLRFPSRSLQQMAGLVAYYNAYLFHDLYVSWSSDDRIGHDLDASTLSDDHGDPWGFTGTFIGLACQDLTGQQLPAEFDYLEVR